MTEPRRRKRRLPPWLGWALLLLGLLLIGLGYAQLAVPPDTPPVEASRRAFSGMALVVGGALTGLLSRWL